MNHKSPIAILFNGRIEICVIISWLEISDVQCMCTAQCTLLSAVQAKPLTGWWPQSSPPPESWPQCFGIVFPNWMCTTFQSLQHFPKLATLSKACTTFQSLQHFPKLATLSNTLVTLLSLLERTEHCHVFLKPDAFCLRLPSFTS